MIVTKKHYNTDDVQNIMTLKLNTRTVSSSSSIFEGWELDVEDERTLSGDSLESLRSCFLAMSYVLHNTTPGDDWADAMINGSREVVCHIYTFEASEVFHWLRNIFAENLSVFTNTWMNPLIAYLRINNCTFQIHDVERLVGKSPEEWAEDDHLSGNITMEGMKQYRERYRSLYNIPVTQAAELRRECKRRIKSEEWFEQTKATIKSYDFKTYRDLCQCFMGGTLGVSKMYRGLLLRNVKSADMGSAYPGVMVSQKFPVTPWEPCTYDRDPAFRYYLVVHFRGVRSRTICKFWPYNMSEDGSGQVADGLGLESAEELTLTLTDCDLEIFRRVYDFESEEILECYRSRAEYLPRDLVLMILKDYKTKTKLKGTGEASKYRKAKVRCTLYYGVAVTKTITDEILFEGGEWKKEEIKTEKDFIEKRDKLLKSRQFLSYQIGVWVTAYVRAIMWDIIPEIDQFVVYFDTDAVKHTAETDAVERANEKIRERIREVSEFYNIPLADFSPKGRTIGCFEEEALAYEFKALDVKRYAQRTDEGVTAKISGLPRGRADIQKVDEFKPSMKWTPEESGRFAVIYNHTGGVYSVAKVPAGFSIRPYNYGEEMLLLLGRMLDRNVTRIFRGC